MDEQWLCWLYQYGVGGLVFGVSIWLAARAGALPIDRYSRRGMLAILVAGYLGLAAIHGVWITAVIGLPLSKG
jgi:hypothetical protein